MGVQHVGHHRGHGQCDGTPRPPDQQHRPGGLQEGPQGLQRRLTGKMVLKRKWLHLISIKSCFSVSLEGGRGSE